MRVLVRVEMADDDTRRLQPADLRFRFGADFLGGEPVAQRGPGKAREPGTKAPGAGERR